jgi:hypothetical protein
MSRRCTLTSDHSGWIEATPWSSKTRRTPVCDNSGCNTSTRRSRISLLHSQWPGQSGADGNRRAGCWLRKTTNSTGEQVVTSKCVSCSARTTRSPTGEFCWSVDAKRVQRYGMPATSETISNSAFWASRRGPRRAGGGPAGASAGRRLTTPGRRGGDLAGGRPRRGHSA